MVILKSAYLPCDCKDGSRYLAETLWPEGVETFALSPFVWMRELAPSYALKEMAVWKRWGHEKFRNEYKQELQEPERMPWFETLVKAAESGDVTLLHNSYKKESQITPGDTTVSYLKEFLEMELERRPQTLPAAVTSPDASFSPEAQQWFNEGGR